jgi:hypothetical protein
MPPSVRESLHKLAEARLRLLRETTDAKLEVGNKEFSVAVENQTARGVSKADALERMRLSGVAPTPPRLPGGPKPAAEDVYYFTPTAIWGYTPTFIAPRTDKLWFADASELPGAHLYLQLQQFMAEEVALLVLGWFSAAGTLTLPEVHKLTDAVRHSVEQLR